MMAKTHMAFANALALAPLALMQQTNIYTLQNPYELPIIIAGVTLGSLLPDIDEKGSTISRLSIVTWLFSWYLKYMQVQHRGVTHQIIFLLLFVAIAITAFFTTSKEIFIFLTALAYGILGHHLGDMMSGAGIHKGGIYNYFWPFYTNNKTTKFLPKFMRCTINGIKEKLYFVFFMALNTYLLLELSPLQEYKFKIIEIIGNQFV
jgi:membrane-bound metal-dependent hydrolase YbcI (DUF457 family)